ncbi:hypothetical protein JMJ77_0005528 [Colletotrichum scovillei]|uniref:Uncharacterized protein n=1 Tax=Colletotrichum scovillei TaxID=1209932 RepID=A0A9P7UIA9_9PEZI|nr:hypothetical protein JMJ77_0005528 [Colletotrichum scovillei]KAG7076749.1 hypothetical protein JMJ76_0014009 [Colletotrichum scovillei]KAG7083845.1 hypothetical protein JMJ78_0009286 [Colletotrichum scovillei]
MRNSPNQAVTYSISHERFAAVYSLTGL